MPNTLELLASTSAPSPQLQESSWAELRQLDPLPLPLLLLWLGWPHLLLAWIILLFIPVVLVGLHSWGDLVGN